MDILGKTRAERDAQAKQRYYNKHPEKVKEFANKHFEKNDTETTRNNLREDVGLTASVKYSAEGIAQKKQQDTAREAALAQQRIWAENNEKRIKNGQPLEIINGQIYSFVPLTKDILQKSIDWADNDIARYKEKGGHSSKIGEWADKLLTYAGHGDNTKDRFDTVDDIDYYSELLRDRESKRAVYVKYLQNAEYEEAMSKIKKNGDKELFSELYSIDTRKPTLVDSLGNAATAAMGGISMSEDKTSDIAREHEILTLLKAKYGDDLDYYRQLYANGVNSKYKSSIVKRIEDDIEEHPVLGTIGYTAANVLTSPIIGIAALSDNIAEAAGNYSATGGSIFQDMSETTTQKVNEVINDTFKNKYAAGLVRSIYNAAVAGTESMLAMGTFGKLGEAVLGLGAATATYKQARERGLSDGQALMNGVAAGLFETLFEHLSLEKLRVFQASPSTTLKPFIKNVLKQSFVEGMEEFGTDLANEAYDYLINGGLSQYEQALYNGVTAAEYAKQFGSQLIETLFTGALSGGGMVGVVTAPSAISGSINTVVSDKAAGNKIRQYGNVNEVLNEAKEQGGILAKKAANTEKKLNDNKSVSDRTLGQIERNTIRKQRAAAVDDILSGEEYKELSKKEKNAIRSSVLTFFSSNGHVAPEQGTVLQTENGKKVLKAAYNWAFDKADKKTAQVQENKRNEIREAVSAKNTESLVKNTFTAVNAEGHTVEAGAVRSITDGVFEIVQDESGATAKLTDLNIKDRQARELYKELQTAAQADVPLSVEAVNVALSMYNTYDNTSARMYALWAHDAYKAGAMGFTFNEFEEMFHGKYKGDITKAQLRELFEAGARNITTKVGITRIGHKGLSKHQAEQVFIIEQLAKESGLEILIVDEQLTDSEGRVVNGLYKEGTNRIVLSLQGEYNLILTHAGHEMFHYVKSQSTEMGQFLQDTVINVLKTESKYDFEGIYKQVSEAYEGLAENDILEEIAAQYMAVALSNEKTINRIVNEATDTEKSFLQKIVDHLKDFIKSVKELLKIYGSQDKTVRAAVETPVEQLEYMADMFEKALKEAAKIKKPAVSDGGVKYSKQKLKKNSAKSKKSYYNEVATTFMIWANSESTPVGSVLRQSKKGKVQFFLKTETGVLSIDKYEYEKIVSKENEYVRELNIIRKRNADADNGIFADSGRRSSGNVYDDGYTGDAKRSNIADEKFTAKEAESGDFGDMANDGQHNSEISKDTSSTLQSQKSGYQYSRQLTAETEEGIEQITAENEDFGGYIDRVLSEINEKIADKRVPGDAKGYGRDAFIDIAREYNAYNYNERGSIRTRYSNNELAVNIERVLVGMSEGILSAKEGLTILSDIQEDILSDGYDFENTGVNVAFRKELKNKPIYVSENTYNELLERYGGKKKLRAVSFNQLSIKPADDTHKENIKDIYEYLQKEYSELLVGASSEIGMIEDLIVTEREVRPKVSYYSKEYNFGGEMDIKEAATRRAAEILQKAFEVELVDIDVGLQYHQLLAAKRSLEDRKRFYKENLSKAADISYRREQKQRTYNRIIRTTRRLDRLLREETDTNHIPENLKHSIAQLLSIIVPNANNSRGKSEINRVLTLDELEAAYLEYQFENSSSFDDDVLGMLKELKYILADGRDIRQLSSDELIRFDTIIEHFSFLVRRGNEMFVDGRRRYFKEIAEKILRQISEHEGSKSESKYITKFKDMEFDMLRPVDFFKNIATKTLKGGIVIEEELYRMYRDLIKGQNEWYRNIYAVREELSRIQTLYGYKEAWKDEVSEYTLQSGEKIYLSKESIMYIAAVNQREVGSAKHLSHIFEGGIIADDRKDTGAIKKTWEKLTAVKNAKEAEQTAEKKREEVRKKATKERAKAEKDAKNIGEEVNPYTLKAIDKRESEGLKAIEKEVKDAVTVANKQTEEFTGSLRKKITYEDIVMLTSTLTEDMVLYSQALVTMMSTMGADMGNKVSMELFGIKKFGEENYIPITVAKEYLQLSFSPDKGETRLKNRSFTKRTVEHANAPIYAGSITDITVKHMQEMSLYGAMTIPLENITRVLNYKEPTVTKVGEDGTVDKTVGQSFRDKFKAVFGDRASDYMTDLLRDLNGAVQVDSRGSVNKMVSLFKKSSVAGSLSVTVQQPSAVVRAMGLVDVKYFYPSKHNFDDYKEMMQYCAVAGIKEIGRFDTGIGQTAEEWILNEKGNFFDKTEDFLMFLPGFMDNVGWTYIWQAVKRETRAIHKDKSGEELLKLAAQRFDDVINYTQVYDSVLSRSAIMRSKNEGAKMLTSFMAEPTVAYNMLRDAARNMKYDKKGSLRTVGAWIGAALLNAVLKSFVTALRRDDEETAYWEVYLAALAENFISDVFILNMIPFVKDIISMLQGYSVDRPDMTVFGNLFEAAKPFMGWIENGKVPSKGEVAEEVATLVGAISAFSPIPINNVIREAIAIVKTVMPGSPDFSWAFVGYNISDSVNRFASDEKTRIYRAILNGNTDVIERYREVSKDDIKKYKEQGYSETDAILKAADNAESNFHSKVIEGLVSEDSRIQEAAEARLSSDTKTYEELLEELSEQGFDRNDVIKAVEKYITSMEDKAYKQSEMKDKSTYTYDDLYNAINAGKMTSAKHIFDNLSKNVKKETVQENIRDEYAEAVYQAILGGNKTEKQHFEKVFKEFEYDYHYAVILGLRENDLRIFEAAEARYNGNFTEYESIKADIVADGFEENDVFNAIEIETEKLSPEKEDDEPSKPETSYLYEPADLKRYAESFKLEPTRKAIEDFRARGKEDGDIRKELTDAFKKKYKEAWLSGDDTTVMKIRDFLLSCNVGYDSGDFSKWEKEALKK